VRPMWLLASASDALRFTTDGLFALPEDSIVSRDEATFSPTIEVDALSHVSVTVVWRLYEMATGANVASAITEVHELSPGKRRVVHGAKLSLSSPHLWSVHNPHLYRLSATLIEDDTEVDTVSVDFFNRSLDCHSLCICFYETEIRSLFSTTANLHFSAFNLECMAS
jgi:hypothetical protein